MDIKWIDLYIKFMIRRIHYHKDSNSLQTDLCNLIIRF